MLRFSCDFDTRRRDLKWLFSFQVLQVLLVDVISFCVFAARRTSSAKSENAATEVLFVLIMMVMLMVVLMVTDNLLILLFVKEIVLSMMMVLMMFWHAVDRLYAVVVAEARLFSRSACRMAERWNTLLLISLLPRLLSFVSHKALNGGLVNTYGQDQH